MMSAVSRCLAVARALYPTINPIRTRKSAMIMPKRWSSRRREILRPGGIAPHFEQGVHAAQIVALQVAEQDVATRRKTQGKSLGFSDADLTDPTDEVEQ